MKPLENQDNPFRLSLSLPPASYEHQNSRIRADHGVEMHSMVDSNYDWKITDLEDFRKNGASKGEYNEAIRLAKLLSFKENESNYTRKDKT